jgi:hypothetical protein
MEHHQEEEGEAGEGCQQAKPEEEEDLQWEPSAVEAAVIQHRASGAAEEEEHQQEFRSAEAEQRLPHRWLEQAWMEMSLCRQQTAAWVVPWCQTG